jgi:hypothetical protein
MASCVSHYATKMPQRTTSEQVSKNDNSCDQRSGNDVLDSGLTALTLEGAGTPLRMHRRSFAFAHKARPRDKSHEAVWFLDFKIAADRRFWLLSAAHEIPAKKFNPPIFIFGLIVNFGYFLREPIQLFGYRPFPGLSA